MEYDESFPASMAANDVPEFLAQKKAHAAIRQIDDGIILTADSVVIQNREVFGKPADRDEAIAMLQALENDQHTVITGVCLKSASRERLFSCKTVVHLAPMSNEEIIHYVDTFKPFDKAGAYAIQEWIGHCKVTKITGSYNNVIGLPTHLVYAALQNFPG